MVGTSRCGGESVLVERLTAQAIRWRLVEENTFVELHNRYSRSNRLRAQAHKTQPLDGPQSGPARSQQVDSKRMTTRVRRKP